MESEPTLPLRCNCRRKAETSLRCSRCFAPICPDCSQSAPIGMLCKECVRGGRSVIYQVGMSDFLRGLGASLFVGVSMGWILATAQGFGIMLAIWGGLFHALVVSEACLRATRYKRGIWMEIAVSVGCIGGVLAGWFLESNRSDIPLEVFFTSPYGYFMIVIATCIAVSRVRSL